MKNTNVVKNTNTGYMIAFGVVALVAAAYMGFLGPTAASALRSGSNSSGSRGYDDGDFDLLKDLETSWSNSERYRNSSDSRSGYGGEKTPPARSGYHR